MLRTRRRRADGEETFAFATADGVDASRTRPINAQQISFGQIAERQGGTARLESMPMRMDDEYRWSIYL